MTPRSHHPRAAFTLVETLTTIVLLSAFLTIGCSLVKLLLSVETGDRDHIALMQTTSRLARQFRDDVHHALLATLYPASADVPSVLLLEMPDGRLVRYEAGPKALLRVDSFHSLPLDLDDYDLGGRPARFLVEGPSPPSLVGITFDRRKTARLEDPRPVRIDAALGLSLRFRRPLPEHGR